MKTLKQKILTEVRKIISDSESIDLSWHDKHNLKDGLPRYFECVQVRGEDDLNRTYHPSLAPLVKSYAKEAVGLFTA